MASESAADCLVIVTPVQRVADGVHEEHIYLMDPYPGRGLMERPANFFLTMQQGHVVVGLPRGVRSRGEWARRWSRYARRP